MTEPTVPDPAAPTAEAMLREMVEEPRELTRYLGYLKALRADGLGGSALVVPLDAAINWSRANSIWPLTFGIACCAIEMMAVGASKFDLDRFGAGAFRPTPRQADLMIVAGTVTHMMAPRLRRLWEQMPDPKFVMAMGACTIGGGPYCKHGYSVIKGIDKFVPVDIYVAGCPPRPEALIDALLKLQEKIRTDRPLEERFGGGGESAGAGA